MYFGIDTKLIFTSCICQHTKFKAAKKQIGKIIIAFLYQKAENITSVKIGRLV